MHRVGPLIVIAFGLFLSACEQAPAGHDPSTDSGVMWAKHAAEYQAVTAQVYAQATRDLPRLLADQSWNAVPGHEGDTGKPPAIILDVDETVVSSVDFEIDHYPYTSLKHYEWTNSHKALPIRGVADFVATARSSGIEVFYVTNRLCEVIEGNNDTCPQKAATIEDIREVGIEVDTEHVLLAGERPGWGKEKLVRREHIAKTHRVIMLVGDDYSDFIPCTRAKPVAPCMEGATRASRAAALDTDKDYWGNGWYILPNPMYGSWTSVR
jgi:acid phosphatase